MQVLYLSVRYVQLKKEKSASSGWKQTPLTARMYSADGILQPASPTGENEKEIENQQLVKNN